MAYSKTILILYDATYEKFKNTKNNNQNQTLS